MLGWDPMICITAGNKEIFFGGVKYFRVFVLFAYVLTKWLWTEGQKTMQLC